MKKLIVILIIIILAGAGGWQIYRRISASSEGSFRRRGPLAVPVELEEISRGTVRDTGIFTGTLDPASQFIASPKIGGKLEKLFVDIGDRIENGKVLAELDDDEYIQQCEQAKADLAVTKANVKQAVSAMNTAGREYERIKSLHEKNMASESELDSAKAAYDAAAAGHEVAVAQVARSEAAVKAAEIRLSYTKVTASWDTEEKYRYVGERFVEQGAMLKANEPIVSVVDMSSLRGVIYIIDADYAKVRAGQAVSITSDAFPGKTFPGTVKRLAPVLMEQSRQARLEIEIPNPDLMLKPGMFIRAELEFSRHEGVPLVPVTALAKRGGELGVFIADRETKKVAFIPVQTGIEKRDTVEIVKPADIKGSVVTLGHHILEDGGSIIISGDDKKTVDETNRGKGENL